MAYHNLGSKLERAVAAYLVNQGCGSIHDVLTSSSREPKQDMLYTIVRATLGKPEVPMSGIYRVQISISVRATAVEEPDTDTGLDLSRIAFDDRLSKTFDALMVADEYGQSIYATATSITDAGRLIATPADDSEDAAQFAAANADMADLTIQNWFDAGFGQTDSKPDGCAWEQVLLFEAIACPSNTD